jgi:subtilisin family serine protease
VKTVLGSLKELESNNLIHQTDINFRCYLSCVPATDSLLEKNELIEVKRDKVNTEKGVRIAIVDSGIDKKIKKFKKSIVSKIDVTTELWGDLAGHGTLMAGGILDIAPQSEIVDVKIATRSGLVYASDILVGLDELYSMHIDILFLGVSSPVASDGTDVLSTMCNKYSEEGVLVVVPAGNFGPEPNTIGFTSQISKSFCIGSINMNGKESFFSSRTAEKPDFFVMGENITSTTSTQGTLGKSHPSNSEQRIVSGTSIAAARFAGLLALAKKMHPDYGYKELHNMFLEIGQELKYITEKKIQALLESLSPKKSPITRAVLISSLVTFTLGLFGIGSIFLFR